MSREPTVVIELGDLQSPQSLQVLLQEKLAFPSWYGRNWDAFWDAITGLVEMPIQLHFNGWSDFEKRLPREAKMLKSTLEQMSTEYPESAPLVRFS